MPSSAAPGTGVVDDSSPCARAIFNIEDLSVESERLGDSQPAMINILEDSSKEKARLQQTYRAVLNVLEDSWEERDRLHQTQQAILNILEDLEQERERIRQLNAELEDRVCRRTEELERANRNLGAFTYSVAHDLRSPLRAMSGFSRVLLEEYGERLDETGRGYAQRVYDATVRMARLIDDLLQLSRMSSAEVDRQRLDLSAIVRAIAADLQAQEPGRRAAFDVEDRIVAPVDGELFRTVLQNLLNNAWKFTAKREEARIQFGAIQAEADKTAFFVRDNGVGFDDAYADKLFEPFQRLHSGDEYPGTGIGLASACQVVERHGGSIWAEGKVDQGATFYVTIATGEYE